MITFQSPGRSDARPVVGQASGQCHPLRHAARAQRFFVCAGALLLLLSGGILRAAPVDQNFDTIEAGTTSELNGALTFDGVVYSTDAEDDQLAVDTINNITGNLPSLGSGNGLTSVWLGSNTGTYLQFAAVDNGDNFRIESFNAEVWGHNSHNSEVYTVTGYDDGVIRASATVNFRVTATYGAGSSTIDYLRLTTPDESTSSGDGANAGTLSFTGDGWNKVDRIRITVADEAPNTILGVSIDNLNFAEAVVPVTDLAGNELIGLPYTSSESYFFDPNDAPTDITLSNSSVNQSGGENATVGTLTATDADESDTHLYSLVAGEGDTDNASFNIFEKALRANDASALAAGEYSVRIRATDNDAAAFEKSFAITVVDDVSPVITSAATAGGTYGSAFAYTITASGGAASFGASGLPAGLSINTGTGEITGSPEQTGVFNVELSAADAADNADTQSLEITVAKAAASIELVGLDATYDGTAKSVSVTTTPDGLTVSLTYDGEAEAPIVAGSYAIVATINDDNYEGTVNGTLVVGKAALIATADEGNRAYGEANPEFTGSFTGAVEGDNLTVSYSTTATETSPVGTYDIVPAITDPDDKLGNYTVTLNNGTLTVGKAVIIATADDQSRAYGAAHPGLTIRYSGFVNEETVEALDELPVAATEATTASAVGEYDITLSGGVDGNYAFDLVAGTLTVTPAALVATADDASRAYGAANPAFTGSLTGAVHGDNLSVAYATSATETSAVGTYDIVPAITDPDEKLGNYAVTLNNGTLTVDKAVIVATADAQSRAYGAANPELTISYAGFVNEETVEALDELPVAATEATTASAVGEYDITLSGGVDGNYAFDLVAGTLTVTPAALVATADDASRAYGAANPAFTGSLTGAVHGDNLSVAYATSATETSAVGTYDIVPAITDPDEKLGNYAVTLNNGTLTVGKAVIVATADDQSRAYGAANPGLTIRYSGFVNEETVEALDELPVAATEATTGSVVGNHDITVSGGADTNYEFIPVSGVLTITPVALIVTADDASRPFGQANPVFTGSTAGLVNNDAITADYSTLATTESPAGTYDIVPVLNDPDERLANYTVTLNSGTLNVTGDDAPVISLGVAGAVYTLRDEPALVAPAVTITDGGSPDFGGGTLSVSVQLNDEALPQDQLHLLADETPGGLTLQDNALLLNSVAIGTFTGGFDRGLPLQVTFNQQATPAIAQALLRRLAFATTNGVELATRALSLQLTDGEGGVSDMVELPVAINRRPETGPDTIVTLVNAPVVTLMERLLANDGDPDSDEFSLHAVPEVTEAGGLLVLVGGELTYTPPADFAGVDSFDYVLVDARGGLAAGRVTLKVLVDKMMAIDLLSAIDPELAGAGSNDAVVHLAGFPGRTFRVEAADDLAQPVWDDLGLATVDEHGLLKFIDPSTYQRARRFFRLIGQAD